MVRVKLVSRETRIGLILGGDFLLANGSGPWNAFSSPLRCEHGFAESLFIGVTQCRGHAFYPPPRWLSLLIKGDFRLPPLIRFTIILLVGERLALMQNLLIPLMSPENSLIFSYLNLRPSFLRGQQSVYGIDLSRPYRLTTLSPSYQARCPVRLACLPSLSTSKV